MEFAYRIWIDGSVKETLCPMRHAFLVQRLLYLSAFNPCLLDGVVFDKVPDTARAGSRAKATTDAKILINRILIFPVVAFFSADGKLRADGYANSAVATSAAG